MTKNQIMKKNKFHDILSRNLTAEGDISHPQQSTQFNSPLDSISQSTIISDVELADMQNRMSVAVTTTNVLATISLQTEIQYKLLLLLNSIDSKLTEFHKK